MGIRDGWYRVGMESRDGTTLCPLVAGPGQVGRVGLQDTGRPVEFDGMSRGQFPGMLGTAICGRETRSD